MKPWLDLYFSRIGYTGTPRDDLETLKALQQNHLKSIPFENLDVFLTGKISLDDEAVFDKLVTRKRGGWCFEQNALLTRALVEIGFEVRPVMGRNTIVPDRPRTHQVALVLLNDEVWLADVGFGGQPLRTPIRLKGGETTSFDGQEFRVTSETNETSVSAWKTPPSWTLWTKIGGEWKSSYNFTTEAWQAQDFSVANHYHVSASNSSFHANRFVTMVRPNERVSYVDDVLKTYRYEYEVETVVSQVEIASAGQLQKALQTEFNIDLSVEDCRTLLDRKPAKWEVNTGF